MGRGEYLNSQAAVLVMWAGGVKLQARSRTCSDADVMRLMMSDSAL